MQRPQALSFGSDGESGTYSYDGSGNITAIGTDTFLYDAEGRLVTAVVRGVTGSYSYDAFGNRKTATGETNCYGQTVCATPLTVSSSTNRLLTTTNGSTTNVGYDAAGNITSASGGNYTYDGTGMMTQATVGSDDRQFVYTADDERIAVRQGVSWTWTVRGVDNKVLREFTSAEPNNNSAGFPTPGGQWKKDYIWRDGLLLASTDTTGTYHYHLDHLGTPRLITNANGVKVAEHAYYPFGAEIDLTTHESPEEAMKFTSHERDTVAGNGHTLDDMHARYYNASLGRFLEVDPILGKLDQPQSSRYSYSNSNPINRIDPDGRAVALSILSADALNETWSSFAADESGGQNTNQAQPSTPQTSLLRTAVASALGLTHYRRSPDYLSASISIAIPIPKTFGLISYTFNMIVDRYGRVYWAPLGAGAGKSFLKGAAGGVTAGWLLQKGKPSKGELQSFITAWSVNGSAGRWGGGGVTWGGSRTPGSQHAWGPGMGFAFELGGVTPQYGMSAGYSWETWFHLGNGWD